MVVPVPKSFLSVLIKQHCLLLKVYKLTTNEYEVRVSVRNDSDMAKLN